MTDRTLLEEIQLVRALERLPTYQPVVFEEFIRKRGAEIEAAVRDAERLDFVQAQTKGYGKGWILRESVRERGMRLHETSRDGAATTVREAVDAAREKSNP